jgi:hypothetical protein
MKTTQPITSHSTNSVLGNCRIDPSRNDGFIRKRFLRKMMAALLMGASLAIFLYAAGGVSYGDSAGSTPLSVTTDAQFYPTFGTPNDALVTDGDDGYVLVSVSQVVHPPFGATGVQVFKKPDFTNPCGSQQIISFPQPIPGSTPHLPESPCKQLTE